MNCKPGLEKKDSDDRTDMKQENSEKHSQDRGKWAKSIHHWDVGWRVKEMHLFKKNAVGRRLSKLNQR